jgi:hypothetical protein
MIRSHTKVWFFIILWIFSCFKSIPAFGLNKVQYSRFHWSYFQTKHFDIYFPQGGDTVAYYAADNVEEMYNSISKTLGHTLSSRIPIIIHNTHAEFEQTNVIRFPLHEAIGGFTEMFKNRIVLPFEGNYSDFYHVLKHEMVHAFVNNLLMGSNMGGVAGRQGSFRFPLWVNEGLAEYLSLGWDLSSEFFMMDATTSGYVSSPKNELHGFLAYKGGQMFFHFLENVYGRGTIKSLIHELIRSRNLERAFKKVTNTSLEEAGEIWLRELRYIYWPELGRRTHGKSIARRMTRHGRDLSFFNLQPAISPDRKEIAFFSDRGAREGVFIINLETEKVTRSVITGGTSGKHESFHSFKSGLSWGPESMRLAIVSKGKGRDVIHIIDAKSGKVLEEIAPDVQAILSPNWSRDGKYISFSGMQGGYTDIYIWNRDEKKLKKLTDDNAYDGKPCFSPSGLWVAFESDRVDLGGNDWGNSLNIYRIRTDKTDLVKVSNSIFENKMPSYGHSDSLLIYVSNRSGIDNLYLNVDSAQAFFDYPLTNVMAGCFTPSWSADGSKLAFTIFENGGWDIFVMNEPLSKRLTDELPKTHFIKTLEDSSLSFFRPINWENLSSYKKDTAVSNDSTLKAGDSLSVSNDTVLTSEDTVTSIIDTIPAEGDTLSRIADTIPVDSGAPLVTADTLTPVDDTIKSTRGDTVISSSDSLDAESEEIAGEKDTLAMKDQKFALDSSEYLDENGLFIKRRYTPIFSLDVASAALGVSNFEGSFGQGFVVLTDLMGDQEIQIGLTLNGDIRENSQVVLEYRYLPYKTDFIIGGFYYSFNNYYQLNLKEKSWGMHGVALYPLSLFTRWQLNIASQYIIREYSDSLTTNTRAGVFSPTLSWSHDNAQWGIVGPVNGQRVNARMSIIPPVFEDDIFFCIGDVDLRKYWMFFKKYSVVFRINAGFSEAINGNRNPHRFLLGGDDFITIYPFNPVTNNLPESDDIEGLFFSEIALPLRGYRFFEFAGNRKILANIEFRFPFIRELTISWPLPISIRQVTGVIFTDYGAAWTYSQPRYYTDERGDKFREAVRKDVENQIRQAEEDSIVNFNPTYPKDWPLERREIFEDQQGMGMGYGMRINLGIFVLRWTRAWAIEGVGTHKKSKTDYWSLGAEF